MRRALLAAGVAAAACLVYANSVSGQFLYDDHAVIVTNPLIRNLDRVPLLFSTSYWDMHIGQPKAFKGGLYRPFTMATFALNYHLGNLNPAGYHLTNILLHAATSVLLIFLCLNLGLTLEASALAGLFFAVFPVHTEAVSSVVGRSEILSGFFLLSAWVIALGEVRWASMLVAPFCFLLALLSKENSAAFLPVFILSDFMVRRKSWRNVLRERWPVWFGFGVMLLLYLEWRMRIIGSLTDAGGIPYFTDQSRWTVYLSVAKFMILHYIQPLLLGTGLCVEYTRPSFPDALLSDAVAWVSALFLIGLVTYAVYSFGKNRSKAAFCVLVFLGLLFPVSNLWVRLEVIGAERFLYLPSIGYAIGLGLLGAKAASTRRWKSLAGLGLACLFLWYGWKTFERNRVWQSPENFWTTLIHDAPRSPRSWNGYGLWVMSNHRYDEALGYFKKSADLNPMMVDAYFNAAECYFLKGDYAQAQSGFMAVLEVKPFDTDSLLFLGIIADMARKFKTAADYYTRVLQIDPFDERAQHDMAIMHRRMGKPEVDGLKRPTAEGRL